MKSQGRKFLTMKIAITGASGRIGQQLVPLLKSDATDLLVVGRDVEKLDQLFPKIKKCSYKDMVSHAQGFDLLIHLAVMNNDRNADSHEFQDVNVNFLQHVISLSQACNIKTFVNMSSTHALNGAHSTNYAQSKKMGDDILLNTPNLNTKIVYLPYVYGASWGPRLKFLDKLPRAIALPCFKIFAALKPTLHIQKLSNLILSGRLMDEGQRIILTDNQDENWFYLFARRAIDLTFAVVVLVFLSWLLMLVWASIKLETKGPGIFVQVRVGKNGKTFKCFKFRTMFKGTKQAGTHSVSEAAVTRIGRFLRRTKIDELPQIINIFSNQLSLIGPRPCLPVQEELVERRRALGVFNVKPGISGHAQVQNVDMSDPKKLAELDAEYVALRGLLLDLKIIVATATGSGGGDNTQSQST